MNQRLAEQIQRGPIASEVECNGMRQRAQRQVVGRHIRVRFEVRAPDLCIAKSWLKKRSYPLDHMFLDEKISPRAGILFVRPEVASGFCIDQSGSKTKLWLFASE